MSYSVRSLRRCASRSFPFDAKNFRRSSSSDSMRANAASNLSFPMTNCFAGVTTAAGIETPHFPVKGSSSRMESISSPKNSTRIAFVSYAGKMSTTSPRTRNAPGAKS